MGGRGSWERAEGERRGRREWRKMYRSIKNNEKKTLQLKKKELMAEERYQKSSSGLTLSYMHTYKHTRR